MGNPPRTRPRIQALVRIQALELLSVIGSKETVPWLVNFFQGENIPMVKAAAVMAIGNIGVDPEGIAIQAFLAAVNEARVDRNEQVLISVAAATGLLCRFSGPPLFETGAKILISLIDPRQHPLVQRQARRELEQLTGNR